MTLFRCAAPRAPQIVPNMLAHPPFDKSELDQDGKPFYLLHLTYPCRYDKVRRQGLGNPGSATGVGGRAGRKTPCRPAHTLPPRAFSASRTSLAVVTPYS
jgi:hypothetical protein